jgi:hypothetical protein
MGLAASAGCHTQAHSPVEGTTRTEDVSEVIYNESWLKANVPCRDLQIERLDGGLLKVTAQFHSLESHVSRRVEIRTEFYQPRMCDGGVIVDRTDWQTFVLEPRKRVQYQANSLVPAADVRVYVYYAKDIGKR